MSLFRECTEPNVAPPTPYLLQVTMQRLSSFRQSFTTDLQVLLETNKATYFAGETVEGTVTLTASQVRRTGQAVRLSSS